MHELSVTQSILDIALAHAQGAGASRILKVNLVIGELSGLVGEYIQFYFDFVSKGTPAEGAELTFRRVPARFRCLDCGTEYEPNGADWTCPQCGALRPMAVGGRELLVESIEVEWGRGMPRPYTGRRERGAVGRLPVTGVVLAGPVP